MNERARVMRRQFSARSDTGRSLWLLMREGRSHSCVNLLYRTGDGAGPGPDFRHFPAHCTRAIPCRGRASIQCRSA